MVASSLATNEIQALADLAVSFEHDPLNYVRAAYPWGVPGTELENETGPDDWQVELLEDIRDGLLSPGEAILIARASGHGIGKGHPIDMPFRGGVWGDLAVGDEVFDAAGSPTAIIGTRTYKREHYRVTFDDGSYVDVSGEHEWRVRGRQCRRTGKEGWLTLETEEILSRGVKRPNGAALARQWEIPVQRAVSYPRVDLPVDPYTYGVWLGDGDKRSGRITNIDAEVWENIAYSTRVEGSKRTALGLKADLRSAGLSGCTTYTASVDKKYIESQGRLEVLQGLLDTDGWVERCGSAAFASASRQLTVDVIKIARSLGLKARAEKFKPNDHAGSWQTHITWDGSTKLFRIKRKQSALIHAEPRYQKRWIESIEPIGLMEGMCIEVEGGLYLTDDFHVTHNSAFVAWLIDWGVTTKVDTKGVVTANTETQLKTKTWAELARWHRLSLFNSFFTLTATALFSSDPKHEKTWRIDMVPWSERNTEAFAGLHNAGKRILLIFDEGSAIPDMIWEVAEGALTDADTEIIWAVFGNPTRNSGRFRECFGRFAHRWNTRQIDSRTVKRTNKKQIDQWEEDWGEDSDFFRVRVRGEFPRFGDGQLISSEDVHKARKAELEPEAYATMPLVMGVDVARYGDDKSVIAFRQGRKQHWQRKYRGISTQELASRTAEAYREIKMDHGLEPQAVFVDETGVGGGVVDRLLLLGIPVIPVNFGAKASDEVRYKNKRSEIWGKMADWFKNGADIPDDPELADELVNPLYSHNDKEQMVLERKKDTKKRGFASPDCSDALALTFAEHVMVIGDQSSFEPEDYFDVD